MIEDCPRFEIGQRYLANGGSVGEVCHLYINSIDMWIDGKMIILSFFSKIMHYNKDYREFTLLPRDVYPEEYV